MMFSGAPHTQQSLPVSMEREDLTSGTSTLTLRLVPVQLGVYSPLVLQIPILSESLDVCLSKLHWAPNGHHVAVGDCEGKVHIYEAGEVCGWV